MHTQEANWTDADTAKCQRIWQEFQQKHDLSDRIGKTAGIDPESGRVWIGDSIVDVVHQRRKEGLDSPLFFERIGYPTYFRRGAR